MTVSKLLAEAGFVQLFCPEYRAAAELSCRPLLAGIHVLALSPSLGCGFLPLINRI